jgi:hypothetical protein
MDRKMSFFKFCRRSLTALPVFLALISCDKLLSPAGSGEWVQVKIRAVSIAGGAENKTITRAGGASRMVGEPIVQDLGGGMLAEITVEEDLSALRATHLLDNGAKFRIAALKKNTSEIYSWADYTAASSGTLNQVAGNLHVVSGVEYDFVCFSYNSTTASLPDPLNEGGTLGSITVTNADGFLYKRLPATSLSTTSNTLAITLEPQYVTAKLFLDGNGMTITGITAGSISLNAATSGTFDLKEGSLSADSGNNISFPGWQTGTISVSSATSGSIIFLPKASGDYILAFAAGALTLLFDGSSESSVERNPTIASSKLATGGSYTIKTKLIPYSRVGYFAGELKEDASGVWQFEKVLYVQSADELTSIAWSDNTSTSQDTDATDGKTNTYKLSTSSSYTNPAARLCFQKNIDYATITDVSDANYKWYLPAQKQLMAIWTTHNSFESATKFSSASYWSSTQYSPYLSWVERFTNGAMDHDRKDITYRARCVRES